MNKLKTLGITSLLLAIILCISIIINRSNSKIDPYSLRDRYPLLKEHGDILSLSGVVTKKDFNNSVYSRGTYLIDLANGTKFALYGATRNYLYENNDLMDFLHIGDSINKSLKNDTIFVYRNNREYYFILARIINR